MTTPAECSPGFSDDVSHHYVQCFVREQAYGIATESVQEIVPLPELLALPTSPEFLAGFLNIAGMATPVVRVDRLLGFPAGMNSLYTPILVLRGLDQPLALVVDRVHSILKVAQHEIVRIAGTATINDFALGVAECAGQQVILVDPQRLLLEQERECLEALRASAQVRIREAEAVCA